MIPLATVLTGLFNLGLNLIAVFVFLLAFGVDPTWTWLLFPLVVLALLILISAISMILSSLYVRFRDVLIIWSVIATTLFYATPVLYPIEIVPENLRDLILANPLSPIFEQARTWVIDPSAPGAVEAAGGWLGLVVPALIYLTVCLLALWIFRREAPRIAEEL